MRSLLRILFGKRLTKHPDSFALTRAVLWDSIARSIRLQQSMGKAVWLVVHFPDTYIQCQSMLEENGINYWVETETVDEAWFRESMATPPDFVRLLLTDLMQPLNFSAGEFDKRTEKIALMVVERHPCGRENDRVLEFGESLPIKTEVGHFLALDDEVVKSLVPPQMFDLMKTMGLDENDLVSSSMVTRILHRRIRQNSSDDGSRQKANSAAEWLQLDDEARGG